MSEKFENTILAQIKEQLSIFPAETFYTITENDNELGEFNIYIPMYGNEISFSIEELIDSQSEKEIIEEIFAISNHIFESQLNVPPQPLENESGWYCRYLLYEDADHSLLVKLVVIKITGRNVKLKFAAKPDIFTGGEELFDVFISGLNTIKPDHSAIK